MNSQLTVSFGRYKEHVLYGTPCGEYVDGTQICEHGCDGCVAGQNFWDEVVQLPVDLHPKPDNQPILPPNGWVVIVFIIIFILAIIFAWYGHCNYYYNMPLL